MPTRTGDSGEQLTLEEEREEWVRTITAKLIELAKEKLERAETHGVTFDEVRLSAETRGWLTGDERDRTLSFGASVMRRAGAVATGYQPSKHRNSKNRPVRVWVLRKYLDAPTAVTRRVG